MKKQARLQNAVLEWYDQNQRELPWRSREGDADPYHVWLSEIMLQQTTVAAVIPYFKRFLQLWPDIHALAQADLDDVLREWAGLGYYARARNMHKCAVYVSHHLKGLFPRDARSLQKLPGIGPYTAAAISAIAFNLPAVAVDGNIQPVVSRICHIVGPLPESKKNIHSAASDLATGIKRPGDYTQALMDIGATICTPRAPKCKVCPLSGFCLAFKHGGAEKIPVQRAKKKKPRQRGVVCWISDGKGRVLMRRRTQTGLLEGMMEFPSSAWGARKTDEDICSIFPGITDCHLMDKLPGIVRHVFTHFILELDVYHVCVDANVLPTNAYQKHNAEWIDINKAPDQAMPSLMKKVYTHCLKYLA